MLILTVQIGHRIVPGIAQEDIDAQEIKKVIEAFLENFMYKKLDPAMEQVSANYYVKTNDNNVVDYEKFRSKTGKLINAFSQKYTDYTIIDVKVFKLDVQGNKASAEISYNWKGFNLDTLTEESGKVEKLVYLAKEQGSWKITMWERFQAPIRKGG